MDYCIPQTWTNYLRRHADLSSVMYADAIHFVHSPAVMALSPVISVHSSQLGKVVEQTE